MFCPTMGNGIPITCTTTYQKWTGQPRHLAGSKNPLPLDMGSVKKNGSWISNTMGVVFSLGILGLAAGFSDSSSTAMAFVFAISMFKFLFGAVALIAVLCIAFVAYPFTTVYYLIKNLQTA